MTIRQISTAAAATPSASYSQAMVAGNLVATGGQVGKDPVTGELGADFATEVRLAIGNLVAVLDAAGTDIQHVIKTNCFLTDIADFAQFDEIYQEFFSEPFPARSTVGIALAGGLSFEIEAWAVLPAEAVSS
ncbi:RidA family protein [Microbacterium sp. NPDC003461]